MFAETCIDKDCYPRELPFIPMTIGVSEPQESIDRVDGFEVHQFVWVTQGEGEFFTLDKTEILSSGQGFFVKKYVPHGYHCITKDFSTMWVTFHSGEQLFDYYKTEDSYFFDVPDFLPEATNELAEICRNTSSQAIRAAHGYVWASTLLEAIFKKPISQSQLLTEFLEHNYSSPLSLEEISLHMGIDKYKLSRQYQKSTGETIMQSLRRIRIQKAKISLQYSSYTIEQVGYACGFESPSYFIKVFREETGLTPKQYRNKKQGVI